MYNDYFFRIKVLKVDLVKYGFKELTAQTTTSSTPAHNKLRTIPLGQHTRRALESVNLMMKKTTQAKHQ
jgi:hypothetical protein